MIQFVVMMGMTFFMGKMEMIAFTDIKEMILCLVAQEMIT